MNTRGTNKAGASLIVSFGGDFTCVPFYNSIIIIIASRKKKRFERGNRLLASHDILFANPVGSQNQSFLDVV